jgi:hypothetical protein
MSRLFDPVDLMSQQVEANATKRTPLPVGETTAQITKMEIKDGKSGPNSRNPGTPWARLDLTLEITDPAYLATVGDGTREKAMMFHGIMLDLTKDGKIATGEDRNVRLGKLREACGVNGQPLNALMGQWVRIQIAHKPHHEDPADTVAEVSAITAMG